MIFGLGCGSLIARFVAGRVPASRVLVSAGMIMVVASLALLIAYLEHAFTPTVITSAMLVFIFSTGLASLFSLTGAINANAAFAGSASGLYRFIQMAFGAVCTALVALGGNNSAMAMICVLLFASLASLLAFSVAAREAPCRVASEVCS
ncbi:hypothetical protein [Paraburkholderia sp. GAS448]|uniref:hypothetical protein n=1 Tax=Paraburkholderia sp. GAS448 TaxID=3035136 RepID=UPI003D1B0237